jgi:ribonuclease HII
MPGYSCVVVRTPLPSAPSLELESAALRDGYRVLAGVDEVGRGSWAGPVVAAAVVLPLDDRDLFERLDGVRDSKQLTPERREELAVAIRDCALAIGVGHASHHVIDRIGIAAANRLALLRAVRHLPLVPDALLIDYFRLPDCDLPQYCVPKGDARSLSIAAASIVAKVLRDRWMTRCDRLFGDYSFAAHKGYGTARHREALERLGLSRLHRRSFSLGVGDQE